MRRGRPRASHVCDYIAGMTDRYAIEEHRRLFQIEAWIFERSTTVNGLSVLVAA